MIENDRIITGKEIFVRISNQFHRLDPKVIEDNLRKLGHDAKPGRIISALRLYIGHRLCPQPLCFLVA